MNEKTEITLTPEQGALLIPLSAKEQPGNSTFFDLTLISRLGGIAGLLGVIMILMAIDHASIYIRRWHPFETWDQPLPDYPSLAALLTRLATHPCAPGVYFLMGAGMILFARSRRPDCVACAGARPARRQATTAVMAWAFTRSCACP